MCKKLYMLKWCCQNNQLLLFSELKLRRIFQYSCLGFERLYLHFAYKCQIVPDYKFNCGVWKVPEFSINFYNNRLCYGSAQGYGKGFQELIWSASSGTWIHFKGFVLAWTPPIIKLYYFLVCPIFRVQSTASDCSVAQAESRAKHQKTALPFFLILDSTAALFV